MATVPTWLVYLIASSASLVGVLLATIFSRIGTRELERRSRREEIMRMLRWAAEFAVASDELKATVGIVQLRVLGTFRPGDELQLLIDAALQAVVGEYEAEVTESDYDEEVTA